MKKQRVLVTANLMAVAGTLSGFADTSEKQGNNYRR